MPQPGVLLLELLVEGELLPRLLGELVHVGQRLRVVVEAVDGLLLRVEGGALVLWVVRAGQH